MAEIILINGCGGAGKDTAGKTIIARVTCGAWVDIKFITRTQPWNFDDFKVGLKNASSLVKNFIDAQFSPVIFTGGIFSQERLDYFTQLLPSDFRFEFFWLDVEKSIRDLRREKRARDDGDQPKYFDQIDAVFTDPGTLRVERGNFHRIKAGAIDYKEVADEIIIQSGIGRLAGV